MEEDVAVMRAHHKAMRELAELDCQFTKARCSQTGQWESADSCSIFLVWES